MSAESQRASAPRPLRDCRVVDLSQNLAGPYCTQLLADLGADVIKVEPPGGDPARAWGPPFDGEDSTLFLSTNRGKRSIAVDLRAPGGPALIRRLAAGADIFVQSLRSGVADSFGLGADALRGEDSRLIYCSIAAYGTEGPLRDLPGYDPLMQAHAGLMSMTGQPGTPARVGASVVDMGTGLWAAIGIMAALRERDRTGAGAHIVAALYETALALSAYHLLGFLADGAVPVPRGTGFSLIAPYEAFPTADGQLMIAGANDALFRKLCAALALDGLAADPRFRDNASRVQHRDVLVPRIVAATRTRSTESLTTLLRDAGVPCAPILDIASVVAEPQTAASGLIGQIERSDGGRQASVLPPLRWDGERTMPVRAPPRRNEHAAEILAELGVSEAEVGQLRADGVIR
jgi:crotonobetainyl-CoA:carnitine CoA-transferase CaiB-like acyl-CoA transferase